MRLNDLLITSFIYEEKEYNIDLSFDTVLDTFDVINDEELRDSEKAEINLELLLGETIEDNQIELWNYIYENFIKIKTRQAIQYDLKGNPMPQMEEDDDKPVIDIKQDAEYIYSSFMQAYKINLFQEQGKMHWHEFKALLTGLPPDTIMQRIIQIRVWKPSKHESQEYKDSMRKMQKMYALEQQEKGR